MSIKKNILVSLIALGATLPLFSFAGDLTIINNTNHDSTSTINGGPCSDILGAAGVTKAHSKNVVPEATISKACIFDRLHCKAEVHMTNNCSGPVIATVVFDVKKGIQKITNVNTSEGYVASGNNFTAYINGGPALKTKNWLRRLFDI